jgi:predicted membrane-bound spermidine synthase
LPTTPKAAALEPSTLEHPRVVDDMRRGYR